MASPFYLFRKYQKTFLVIAGVMAMFIFVVADPLMSYLQSSSGGGGGPRSAGEVVATWDGGSLNVRQLDNLTRRRLQTHDFLRNLIQNAASKIEQEGGSALQPTVPDFVSSFDPRQVRQNCVMTRVLAELAEKSGISVSDEVINHYLREWGLRRMGDGEIGTLLGLIGMNDKVLFAGMRELLLSNFYLNSYGLALRGIMPEERWQDWKRINERISVEAAVLPADKFLAAVPEPTDAELQQFYEQHKEREADIPQFVMGVRLPAPDPGFRDSRRVKLQYLVGNVDDWTQKMLDTVEEEEIVDYYERNKRTQFIRTSTSSISSEGLFDDEEEETKSDETDTTDESEAAESDSTEAEAESPAVEEQPSEDESGQLPTSSPFRLAALQTEAAGEEPSETVAVESESDAASAADPAAETEAETEEPEAPTETSTDDEEPVSYEPLENVRDQIRRSLAKDKAVVELQKVVDKAYGRLQSTYNLYGGKVADARFNEKEIPDPPAELSDFVKIAKETGLTSEETVPLSQLELVETIVGKAFDAQSRREYVVQGMFGDQELYEPYRAIDLDGNWYLVSKTEDVPSYVPEFEKVRDAVLAAWKKKEAAKLALAKAEELAKQAEDSGDTVATVAQGAGYETVTTDMFSWMTFGTAANGAQDIPRLGEAPPLLAIGPDFMVQAFELEPDQKVALHNYDQSHAYVIQLANRAQTKAEMRQQYLAEANTWFGLQAMTRVRAMTSQRRLEAKLSEEVGLDLSKLAEMMAQDSQ